MRNEQKLIPSGSDPVLHGSFRTGALEMRKIGRLVRNTASLVSVGRTVRERPGELWAADHLNRIIWWRPTNNRPPFEPITEDQLLFLTVHEASHLNYTGGYDPPKGVDKQRFHLFWNGAEDIRIERLSGIEFPGFEELRKPVNNQALDVHRPDAAGYSRLDQVSLSWIAIENGAEPMGSDEMKEYAKKSWPQVSRICNAKSSADVARGVEPYYRDLVDESKEPDCDQANAESKATNIGGDEPTDAPEQSKGSSDDGMLTEVEILKVMAANASDSKAAKKLRRLAESGELAEMQARADAVMAGGDLSSKHDPYSSGNGIGTVDVDSPPEDPRGKELWDEAKEEMKLPIAALARKLHTTLRANQEDDWNSGIRRGQLDLGRAHRSLMGDRAVFRDRSEVGAVDHVFALSVDVSSSQACRRHPLLRAAVLVAEAIDRAELGLIMLPWCHHPRRMKPLNQRLRAHTGHLGSAIGMPSGSTYEAPALVMIEEDMAKRPSRHRTLITITDGQTSNKEDSEIVIAELMEMGVDCIGIAVEWEAPAHYPKHLRIDDVTELTRILPKLVSSKLVKGGK